MFSQLLFIDPQGSLDLKIDLANTEGGTLIDIQVTTQAFHSSNFLQETDAFIFEALREKKAEHTYLQTKLLEINLVYRAP